MSELSLLLLLASTSLMSTPFSQLNLLGIGVNADDPEPKALFSGRVGVKACELLEKVPANAPSEGNFWSATPALGKVPLGHCVTESLCVFLSPSSVASNAAFARRFPLFFGRYLLIMLMG